MTTIVRSQEELDSAVAVGADRIVVDSPAGVEIVISSGSIHEIRGEASVVSVSGEASVGYVYGEASVGSVYDEASVGSVYGKASVGYVYGKASVGYVSDASVGYVYDEASVGAVSGKASVGYVYGKASVVAVSGKASVGSVYEEASVGYVYEEASVRSVYGKASVDHASGSATIHLHGGTLSNAGNHVAVFVHTADSTWSGGVLIDLRDLDETNLDTWAGLHGCARDGEMLTVYKAVRADLRSSYGFVYPIGETVSDPLWRDDHDCGGGLHFSPTPVMAADYDDKATRFLECRVRAADVRTVLGSGVAKLKARSAVVVREVTITGEPVVAS